MGNLSVRAKIFGLIIFAAIIVSIVGYIGIKNIRAIDEADTVLYEKMLVPITQLSDISVYYQRIRINLRDIIIAN
ncbi:MAG TPA: MCP four helix bundle domain-containing protein, partial [Candidatus Wallbacteria bacterium]|nr:MCP four helix bundle domain-containing protein [Candidatus Wallbacteria bacterium]